MKRVFALLLALVMVFSMAGCKKKVKVVPDKSERRMKSIECGTFNIDGSLGNSGTIKVTGTVFYGYGPEVDPLMRGMFTQINDEAYTYKRSGNDVTMTLKDSSHKNKVPSTIVGTYNVATDTFVLKDISGCFVANAYLK